MINKMIVLLSLAFLVGCASGRGSGNGSDSFGDNSGYSEPSSSSKNRSKEAAREEEEPRPVQTTSREDSNFFQDALKTGNDEAIAKAAYQVLSKNPQDAKALNALGYYHYRKGHLVGAQLFFGKALKANPNLSDAHTNLGLVFLSQKEEREAIQEFRKAIAMNNNDGIAAANLGSIYIENKDYIKGLVAMEIAYKNNRKDLKILNNYGIALAATGKHSEARDIYRQAMSVNPNSKEVMYNYSILLIDHLKRYDEGLDLLNKVKFLGPSPEARNRINTLENKAKAGLK